MNAELDSIFSMKLQGQMVKNAKMAKNAPMVKNAQTLCKHYFCYTL